jgi:hypothetical protein
MRLTKDELSQLLEIAKRAASLAGAIHRRALERRDVKAEIKSSDCDFVTDVGAKISLLDSVVFPNPFLVVANPALTPALVELLREAGV